MNLKRTVQESIASLSSTLFRYTSNPRSGFRVLLYHSISLGVKFDPHGMFTIDPHIFEKQMKILVKNTKVSLVCFSDCLKTISNSDLSVAVTFDDGYKDNLYTVAPIMQKYRIPFTVFVSTSFIQNENPDFLTAGELRELSMLPGVSIGSHGSTHTPLTELDDSMLANELSSSNKYLEGLTGREITSISYPHGRIDKRVRDAVEKSGYKLGASSLFGINNTPHDLLMLCRTCILGSDSVRVFRQKLHGAWDWYKWIQQ